MYKSDFETLKDKEWILCYLYIFPNFIYYYPYKQFLTYELVLLIIIIIIDISYVKILIFYKY